MISIASEGFGKLGLGRPPLTRVSRAELEQEFRDAGFAIRQVVREFSLARVAGKRGLT